MSDTQPTSEEFDTDCTDSPVCPHCGYEHEDAVPRPSLDGYRKQCDDCSEWFLVTCEVQVTWATSKL